MEEDKNKTKEKELSLTGTLKLDRRKFLKSLTLVGTGVLAYSSPAISAVKQLTGTKTLSTVARVIDVQLPVTYKFSEAKNLLNIKVKGQTISVTFSGQGVVVLNKTKDSNIAEVKVQSLRYVSTGKDPLTKAGMPGTITAVVPQGTKAGTLNLKTGIMSVAALPVNISMGTKTMSGGTNPPSSETVTPGGEGGNKYCFKDININLNMKGTKAEPAADVSGTLKFKWTP